MKTPELILLQLKSLGPQSAKMLADRISITTMGIRQHLQQLEQRELVCYEESRTKVGRPTRYWSLTSKGHAQFPDRHQDLSRVLLNAANKLFGDEGVERLIDVRENDLYQRYAEELKKYPEGTERFQALARLRQNDGYMADLETSDGACILVENHCPIGVAATTCGHLCNSELKLLGRLLGPNYQIERIEHIIAGSRRCAYRITPREQ
ncbi:helix-turn-helix transcriptional regulator [Enterobacillus tribolii]|uniref:Transcriptional regulator n=1 Tax=Enterobacillus tribolii TaxID=1487935 RepID=A0A370QE88_9GAMM|nr:metalloregulator ArsR/SmtB family transcription factor [Enterobacillus tribolii]MBW7984278.1 transcriptional regulator [Enterobacillus tribolii]RDK86683.1 transcriptional regulator [Enterobacillus tribolii]